MAGRSAHTKAETALRKLGLSFPETTEEFPWGHRTLKVKGKAFVFMSSEEPGEFGLSLKLPESCEAALALPFAEPTGYGLGKSGWVSARFKAGEDIPVELLAAWLKESYLAVAPKRLAAEVRGDPPARQTSAVKKSPAARSPKPRGR